MCVFKWIPYSLTSAAQMWYIKNKIIKIATKFLRKMNISSALKTLSVLVIFSVVLETTHFGNVNFVPTQFGMKESQLIAPVPGKCLTFHSTVFSVGCSGKLNIVDIIFKELNAESRIRRTKVPRNRPPRKDAGDAESKTMEWSSFSAETTGKRPNIDMNVWHVRKLLKRLLANSRLEPRGISSGKSNTDASSSMVALCSSSPSSASVWGLSVISALKMRSARSSGIASGAYGSAMMTIFREYFCFTTTRHSIP